MPVQTTKKSNIYFPDGAMVKVRLTPNDPWFDVGAINSAVTATLNWDESSVETANAGTLNTRVSNMTISGGFTLINLDPEGIGKMGNGVLNVTTTAAGSTVSFENQVIPSPAANTAYALALKDTNGISYKTTGAVGIASVKKGETTLSAGTDYVIVNGFEIVFLSAPGGDVTITYTASQAVVGKTTVTAGASTVVMTPYAMQIEHTDENGKKRTLDLYSVYGNSGGFQFNFKGANEDGVEEMPLTFTAKLDTTRSNGDQLMAWSIDNGAA